MPHMAWADAYLREPSRLQPATVKVWPLTTAEFCKRFVAAGNASGVGVLGLYPYSLRHGGAPWDALGRRRSIEMIKKRGSWNMTRP